MTIFTELLASVSNFADFADAMDLLGQAYLKGYYDSSIPLPFADQLKELWKERDPKKKEQGIGGSKNLGHFNHMCNVVGTMAHVINYAKNKPKLYGEFDQQRKILLMLLAFYHDLGKTIIPRRHAIEGKVLLKEPKASVQYRFNEIFKSHRIEMPRKTLPYLALLVGAHDMFGTISTGENGVLSIANLIIDLKKLLNDDTDRVTNAISDLWLLSLCDIIVSVSNINGRIVNKWGSISWREMKNKEMQEQLDIFMGSIKGRFLLEDFACAKRIAIDPDPLSFAKNLANERAVTRFQRLARQTLGDVLEDPEIQFPEDLGKQIIKQLESKELTDSINNILHGEFGDNYSIMFGSMLHFDYALGFFQYIARDAVDCLNLEIEDTKKFQTGWLYRRKNDKKDFPYDDDFLNRFNAESVVNNYLIFLTSIFGEIYRLTADIDQWNIEFEDAKNRLSRQKSERILGFEGAYRAGNTRNLLLRQLMLYKA